jgi:hypothetical protein
MFEMAIRVGCRPGAIDLRLRRGGARAAFSGQLVPQDPNEEPASVLLERIRAERAIRKKQPKTRKGGQAALNQAARMSRKPAAAVRAKKKGVRKAEPATELATADATVETGLLGDIQQMIIEARRTAAVAVNAGLTLPYWRVGQRIRTDVLGGEIVATLSRQLVADHGRGFEEKNLCRMVQFADVFPEEAIVVSLIRQLSRTDLPVLPLKDPLPGTLTPGWMCSVERWSVRTLRNRDTRIPKGYDWASLRSKVGEPLEAHYLVTMHRLGQEQGMLGAIFFKAQNKIHDPAKLSRLVQLIDAKRWISLHADTKDDLSEGLLQKNAEDTKSGARQYFTPRPHRSDGGLRAPRADEDHCRPGLRSLMTCRISSSATTRTTGMCGAKRSASSITATTS